MPIRPFLAKALHQAPTVSDEPLVEWKELPPLPNPDGFAGMFAGVSNGALVVAGGANFPQRPGVETGPKTWHESIYVLERPDGTWKRADMPLPVPLAYGVSATFLESLICAGGNNQDGSQALAFALRWDGRVVRVAPMPSLPMPCCNMSGGIVGMTLYVAGGQPERGEAGARRTFWAMDLSGQSQGWRAVEPWPGPGRELAVAGSQSARFYLFSGITHQLDETGKFQPVAPYLLDAYCYTPDAGGGKGSWRRIADPPRAFARRRAYQIPALALWPSHR